ncbi:hypothetical protein GCM10023190_13060 [Enteractinococcus fodinae]
MDNFADCDLNAAETTLGLYDEASMPVTNSHTGVAHNGVRNDSETETIRYHCSPSRSDYAFSPGHPVPGSSYINRLR